MGILLPVCVGVVVISGVAQAAQLTTISPTENQLAQRELSNRIAAASQDAVRSQALMQEQVLLVRGLQDAIAAWLGPARCKQQRHEQQMRTMPANAVNLKDPDFRAGVQEQSQKSLEENTRRLLDDATPHLNPQQVAALRSEFERTAIRRIPFPML